MKDVNGVHVHWYMIMVERCLSRAPEIPRFFLAHHVRAGMLCMQLV